MQYEKTVAIVGGDLRYAHLANTLMEKNNEYKIYGMFLENDVKLSSKIHKSNDFKLVLPKCDIIIFPLPLLGPRGFVNTPQSDEELTLRDCMSVISPNAIVLAGMVPPEAYEIAKEREIELIDYFQREEFAVLNAVPTALYKLRLKKCLYNAI